MLEIDRAIKEIWINEINKLNSFMEENKIRIFTEFHDGKLAGKGIIADIAIVKIGDNEEEHIKNNIDRIYAIIELKHKGAQVPIDSFISDVEKSIKYIKDKDLGGSQFYLGFIHEAEFAAGEISWLENEKQVRMVQGRLTELSACYYEDQAEMIYTVISYNDMNEDLSSKFCSN